ncbi:hypothetical protein SNEBB_005935 [Seison nebaliae]|nr:hypothetical protein SNEBB_005935 [Seison nebaliae]
MFRHLSTTFSKSFSTKSFPFKLGKVNHIAIAVPNVEEAGKLYSNILLADNVSEIKEVKSQKVKVLFVDLGNTKIELINMVECTTSA